MIWGSLLPSIKRFPTSTGADLGISLAAAYLRISHCPSLIWIQIKPASNVSATIIKCLIFNSFAARWHIQWIWGHSTTLTLNCEEHRISLLSISSKGFLQCIATGIKGRCINFSSWEIFLKVGFLAHLFVQILIPLYNNFQKKMKKKKKE